MVFVIQNYCLIISASIILNFCCFLGINQPLNGINFAILFDQTNLNSVHSQSRVFRKDTTLFYLHFSWIFIVMRVPMWTYFIATCVLKPKLSPFSESKLFGCEVFVHNGNEIVKSGIFPCKEMEILSESL